LALIRVLLAQRSTRARAQAQTVLNDLLEAAGAIGRTGLEIEALALQAQAHWQRGDLAGAMTALERSLRLAEPEGYVRLFADLGPGMARLLQEARARTVMPDYVARLLAAFGAGTPLAENNLTEPLSQRELEVLALMAAGLTNREIAARLVISPETVKKHTTAIYGKLGVKNRTEAAARARDLDLLA
jgi:LuxR family transcriptional regulator, maltose regulon positive regulatory protein